MSMFTAFNISASGMTAQQLRTDVISENIANADTTRTSDGTPYVRKAVVFTEKTMTGKVCVWFIWYRSVFNIFRCIKTCQWWCCWKRR